MSADVEGWPDPDNWPTTAEFVAAVKAVPSGFPLCKGCVDATNPDDRDEQLPHHFDCPAVAAYQMMLPLLAQARREGQRDGWDEGYDAAAWRSFRRTDISIGRSDEAEPPNPYRDNQTGATR